MAEGAAGDMTQLLVDWSNGDQRAMDKLAPQIYNELRRLAQSYMNRERSDHTLQATALVNEAYLRLVDQTRVQWRDSVHFTALAAQMMRRILVDHARSHAYAKRGGGAAKIPLDKAPEVAAENPSVIEVDEALDALTAVDEQLAKIVELRFFGGMTNDETAEVLGVSVPTVVRRWRMAKAWLYRYMSGEDADG